MPAHDSLVPVLKPASKGLAPSAAALSTWRVAEKRGFYEQLLLLLLSSPAENAGFQEPVDGAPSGKKAGLFSLLKGGRAVSLAGAASAQPERCISILLRIALPA